MNLETKIFHIFKAGFTFYLSRNFHASNPIAFLTYNLIMQRGHVKPS